jgi:hypothetical protein
MPSLLFLLTGLRLRFTHKSFVAQPADRSSSKPKQYGSTVDRPFLLKITVVSGKNFINVSVEQFGGHGATIDPQPRSRSPIELNRAAIRTGLSRFEQKFLGRIDYLSEDNCLCKTKSGLRNHSFRTFSYSSIADRLEFQR